jgi:DNA-directed RNA polymerase subunit RPC12/RpoP
MPAEKIDPATIMNMARTMSNQNDGNVQPMDNPILQQVQSQIAAATAAGFNILETSPAVAVNQESNFVEVAPPPSGGSFYKGFVYGQPLRVDDLTQIETMDSNNSDDRISVIFSRALRGLDPKEILQGDEFYYIHWLRANTFPGMPFDNMAYECMHCQKEVIDGASPFGFAEMHHVVADREAKIAELKGSDCAEITIGGRSGKVFVRRRRHNSRLKYLLKRDFGDIGQKPTEADMLRYVTAVVVDFGFGDIKDTITFIRSLSPMDYAKLKSAVKRYNFASTTIVDLTCPYCKEVTPVPGYTFPFYDFIPKVSFS